MPNHVLGVKRSHSKGAVAADTGNLDPACQSMPKLCALAMIVGW
jgi:hypothetical protein